MRLRAFLALAGALTALGAPAGAHAEVTPAQAEQLGHEAYRYGIPLYWPKASVLSGDWQPPPLERLR